MFPFDDVILASRLANSSVTSIHLKFALLLVKKLETASNRSSNSIEDSGPLRYQAISSNITDFVK